MIPSDDVSEKSFDISKQKASIKSTDTSLLLFFLLVDNCWYKEKKNQKTQVDINVIKTLTPIKETIC